jgi:hypothetical protein
MDIPEEVREARRTSCAAEYPAMTRFPQLFEQFVEAQLADEWSRKPNYSDISIDSKGGTAVISLARAATGNAVSVPLTMPEALVLWQKLGAVLGM